MPVAQMTTQTESGSTAGQAKEQVKQQAEQAKQQVQQAAGQARGRVRDQVDVRSTQAGERVGGVAQDARSVSETLREQGKDQPAKVVDQVADRAERFGEYLKTSDGDRILRDVEDFGRRQPWAVVGGGLLLGLVASRFLKASSTRRYETSRAGAGYPPRTPGYGGRAQAPAYTPGSSRLATPPPVDLPEPAPIPPARDVSLTGGVPDEPRRDPDFR
jgi:ElaB/YqjD/DUF883 family membrane-anchored ribosome-binding protein